MQNLKARHFKPFEFFDHTPLCELRESRASSVCLDRLGASDRLVRIVGVNRREHEVQIRIDLSVGADGNGDGRYRVARI